MKTTRGLGVTIGRALLLVTGGCASPGGRATSGTPTADVGGVWEGGFFVGPRQSGDFRMTLHQDGDTVSGAAYLWTSAGGRQDFPIVGTVVGDDLHFNPAWGATHSLKGQLIVNGNSMIGDSRAPFGNYPYRVFLERRQSN